MHTSSINPEKWILRLSFIISCAIGVDMRNLGFRKIGDGRDQQIRPFKKATFFLVDILLTLS